jgi:molybdate transport system substrate-binding protein
VTLKALKPSRSVPLPLALTAFLLGAAFAPAAAAQQSLTVFAAASLTDAFTAVGQRFEQEHAGVTVKFNFAGSQALATQMEQGASADVFASADQRWMLYAEQRHLLGAPARVFARNRLVVITPRANPGYIDKLQDLARPGLKLVLAAAQVPVGSYSREALRRLGASPGFGADYGTRVLANLVSEEENVKGVVAKVQLGEADAGIVYATDVTRAIQSQLRVLEIPEASNPIAEYPVAPTAAGQKELAAAFIDLLLSPSGQALLAARGFLAPAPTGP